MSDRQAYITLLCTNDYINGVIALNKGLKDTEATRELYCLIDETIDDKSRELLEKHGIKTIEKPIIKVDPQIKEFNSKHGLGVWNTIFQKLWVFDIDFDKVVYLDGDIQVMKNPDSLFSHPHLTMAQDPAVTFKIPKWSGFTRINAGVMVIEPNKKDFNGLMELLAAKTDRKFENKISDIVCDQSLIDEYIGDRWNMLSDRYNVFLGYIDNYTWLKEDEYVLIHLAGAYGLKMFMPNYDRTITSKFSNRMYKYACIYMDMLDKFPKGDLISYPLISVIIPRYSESEEVIGNLLSDLDTQVGFDFERFEVCVVEDCPEEVLPMGFYRKFKNLKIKRVVLDKNSGPGIARQVGINETKGHYIMFIDADDRLFTPLTLYKVEEFVYKYPETEAFIGIFLQEFNVNGKNVYKQSKDVTWLHGKVYKRRFLEEKNLRFPSNIRVNEDSCFNGIVFNMGTITTYIPEILTIWRYNENSLSRSANGALLATGYPDYIEGRYIILETLRGKIPKEQWYHNLVKYFVYLYLDAQRDIWLTKKDLGLEEKITRMIYDFRKYYHNDFKEVPKNVLQYAYNDMRSNAFKGEIYMEKEGFFEFYGRLEEIYGLYDTNN